MDLSTFGKDGEGLVFNVSQKQAVADLHSNPAEYMEIDDTFSPMVHRVNQAVRQKAIYGGDVGEPAPILTKW